MSNKNIDLLKCWMFLAFARCQAARLDPTCSTFFCDISAHFDFNNPVQRTQQALAKYLCKKSGLTYKVPLSVHPSGRSFVRPSVRSSVCQSVSPSVHPFVCLSVCPFVHPFVCLFIHLFVRLFFRPFVRSSVRLSVRWFVCSSVH